MERHVVREEGLHIYYAQIPNIVDDMELSCVEMRVYLHFKRVAGEQGACWQSTKTIAEHCGISKTSVSESKVRLVELGLIRIENGDPGKQQSDTITIIDIWDKNNEAYAKNANDFTENTENPNDLAVRPEGRAVRPEGRAVRPEGRKKNPIKNNPISVSETETNQPQVQVLSTTRQIKDAFVATCGYPVNWQAGNGASAKWLSENGYSAEQVVSCYAGLKAQPFWADKMLGLPSLAKQIGEFVKRNPQTETDGVDYNEYGYTPSGKLVRIK